MTKIRNFCKESKDPFFHEFVYDFVKDCEVYPRNLKIWSFAKVSALDLTPSKQLLFKWIGAMQRGSKMEMLTQGKTKF